MATAKIADINEILKSKIRKVNPMLDENLPRFSFSKLDCYIQCPFKYNVKYNQKLFPEQKAVYLDLGTLAHKILELAGQAEIKGEPFDYEYGKTIFREGIVETTDKGDETIIGFEKIKEKYPKNIFTDADNASGMNYMEKIDIFFRDVVPTRYPNKPQEWTTIATEKKFEFVYQYGTDKRDAVRFYGFIDKVQQDLEGNIRVVDYKTGKAKFRDEDVKTSLQHSIYNMACYLMYGKLPVENIYDFIFIDVMQNACSKGYMKRALKKIDNVFAQIRESRKSGYKPNPSPLCYFCEYTEHNPSVEAEYQKCEYYSLWTPTNKTFAKNKEWGEEYRQKPSQTVQNGMGWMFGGSSTPAPKKRQISF